MNRQITKFYDLSNLKACMGDFRYVYSPFSKTHYEFRQDKGYVSNFRNDEMTKNSADGVEVPDYFYGVNPDEYAWIGLFSREKYTAGTKVMLHSFYDHFGGPLVSFGDNYTTDENGHNIYGLYFEVVRRYVVVRRHLSYVFYNGLRRLQYTFRFDWLLPVILYRICVYRLPFHHLFQLLHHFL